MMTIGIFYSSIGGNTELTCKKISSELQKTDKDLVVNIYRVDNYNNFPELSKMDLIVLACPTYGQGDLEKQMKSFLKRLAESNIELSKLNYAVVGLGDTKYYPEYLAESANLLEEWIRGTGGNILTPALRIGMPPLKYLDKLVPRWCQKLINS